jgi:hypothetical protein
MEVECLHLHRDPLDPGEMLDMDSIDTVDFSIPLRSDLTRYSVKQLV